MPIDNGPTRGRLRLPHIGIVGVLAAGVGFSLFLLANLTWLNDLPFWFWYQIDRGPGGVEDWLALAGLAACAAWLATRHTVRSFWPSVLGLASVGYWLQIVMAHTEGNGLAPLRRCLLQSGHGTFVDVAIREGARGDLISNYVSLVRSGVLGQYTITKPPGQLLLYIGTERLASWAAGAVSSEERREAFASFAVWAWPAVAMLVVFPLADIARRIGGDARVALLAVALVVTSPPMILIQMHTDQVFYPLLVTSAMWLAVRFGAKPGVRRGAVTGLMFSVGSFCSFGLAAYFPILLSGTFAVGVGRGATTRAAFLAIAVGATVVATYVVLLHGFGFDWYADYVIASAAHADWKDWEGTASDYFYFSFLNSVEFFFWQGGAVAALAGVALVAEGARAFRWHRRSISMVALGWLGFFVVVCLFGKTKAEVARLWLFVAPIIALLAAVQLREWSRRIRIEGRSPVWPAWTVIASQVLFVWLMKQHMDFH